jgi:hypothetical protein
MGGTKSLGLPKIAILTSLINSPKPLKVITDRFVEVNKTVHKILTAKKYLPRTFRKMPGKKRQMPRTFGKMPGRKRQMPGAFGKMPGRKRQMPGTVG